MSWKNELWPEWSIVEELGSGDYGKVYKIESQDMAGKQYAALKVINYPASEEEIDHLRALNMTDGQIKEYFTATAQEVSKGLAVLEKFNENTNIVSFEDHKIISLDGGTHWVVMIRMELLTSLADYLKEHVVEERDVCKLGIDICNALNLYEKEQIIHRDIKPTNIFVTDQGDYKLGEFSLTNGAPQGTYKYMAPEVYNKDDYDSTIDIYSLGLIMYEMVNKGRCPFQPLPPEEINDAIIEAANQRRLTEESLPKPVDASAIMNAIIQNSCAHYPRYRYKSAAVLQQELQNYLDKLGVKEPEEKDERTMKDFFTAAGDL